MSDGGESLEEQGLGAKAEAGGTEEEQELATKTLHIQSKRFYLDVKQNKRGRFIKIAEMMLSGEKASRLNRKNRLLLPMSTAGEFRDHLTEFIEIYSSLGPANANASGTEDVKIKSESMIKDNRRYYLDLKENARGRFLRVSQTVPISNFRSQIAIPAQGMVEFRDSLTDLLKEFGTDDMESKNGKEADLPQARQIRADNKMFYFDVGQNKRGTFMRISEVRRNLRTAITIPESSWESFRDVLNDFLENKPNTTSTTTNNQEGEASSS
ncbi:DgyrCDS830 [Dimorphilus gyrociliatus]|uniref:DgyrCDS830 n=1 Tax=Dimorphilus gyrociliatus TaxID=2664684 RepID=A0A7I8V7J6_9ANNE|nr:DgyrCDS830 [Dimorphilus gyrociliatus]